MQPVMQSPCYTTPRHLILVNFCHWSLPDFSVILRRPHCLYWFLGLQLSNFEHFTTFWTLKMTSLELISCWDRLQTCLTHVFILHFLLSSSLLNLIKTNISHHNWHVLNYHRRINLLKRSLREMLKFFLFKGKPNSFFWKSTTFLTGLWLLNIWYRSTN